MPRAWLVALALLLGLGLARAQVAIPQLRQHVTDQTGTLSAEQVAGLEARLAALEAEKGSQFLILVVPGTGEQPIEQFALAVAEKNRIGREASDDGLLLLVAKDDRKARIEVGYGLEGAVTDALASRVIREYLAPHFRKGEYHAGLVAATDALEGLVRGEALPPPMVPEGEGGAGEGSPLLFAVFLGMFIGMMAAGTRMRPVLMRRLGAGAVAAGLGLVLFSAGFSAIVAAFVAFLLSGGSGGRFGSGRGAWGSFPGGAWGGGFGRGGGGGWSGGGGSFGGGGASGNW